MFNFGMRLAALILLAIGLALPVSPALAERREAEAKTKRRGGH